MVAPSRELACRRPALGGRLHIGTVGLAGREVIPIILYTSPKRSSPSCRIRCRKKPSRGRVEGKSLTRNGSTEHTIEKENPKRSPAFPGPKRNDPKERLRGRQSILYSSCSRL